MPDNDHDRRRGGFLLPNTPLTDNIALIEWFEDSRRILHAGALELGIVASEIDAQLRKVSKGLVVAGMSSRYRASRVSKPIALASESLIIASRYIITSNNRFEAAFMPELQASGYKPAAGNFTFRAN